MNVIDDDTKIQGQLIVESVALQNASFDDSSILNPGAGTPITAPKLQHQHAFSHRQATGTAIVAKTEDLHIVYGATGTVVGVEVTATTAPTGDHTVTVDVQVGSQSVGFATVLTGTIGLSSATAAKQIVAGTLVASPALVAGSIIRVIVTVAGSTSSQGQGLVVTVVTREDAE